MQVTIFAHPNSKRPRIDKDLLGSLHVYVSQPPLSGKANKAVGEALAKHFNVSKSQVELVRGEKSKIKTFAINN
jgi:hypothetical protein